MHYIFSPFGSAGDIHPMVGLARELQKRGHEITFVVSGYFQELVEQCGFKFVPLGTREEFLVAANHPDLWNPLRGFQHIYRNIVEPSLRPQYQAMESGYEPGQTVGVTNCLGFGALIAQDKLGMPVVSVHIQPAVIWSDFAPPELPGIGGPRWLKRFLYGFGEKFAVDRIACPSVNALRGELGLPPVRQLPRYWHSRACVACLFPDWYGAPQPDWPANLIQTDFPLWDERDGNHLPGEVESFLSAGEPPIVFTPGSANMFGKKFFEAAVEACGLLRKRAILLSRFAEQIPQRLPPGVIHFSYVPLSLLLPRCAAFVNHGGIGSVSQGLAAGIPQLIMPLAHDQFDNVARVKRLGAGDSLVPRRFVGANVARSLNALLASNSVAAACRAVAQHFAKRDGCERMAAAIEDHFGRGTSEAT